MHDYNVVWSWEAIYDVADITDYIELRFGKERADRFNDEIDAKGKNLGRNYRVYAGTGIYYRKKLILKKIFNPSIIFYFVDDIALILCTSLGFFAMNGIGRRYSGKGSATLLTEGCI